MTVQDAQSKAALQRIRADVRAMQVTRQPAQGLLKMDTMENPYRLPAELQQARRAPWARWRSIAIPASARRYSRRCWPTMPARLRAALVLLGNGSDEIITPLALATAQPCEGDRARC